MKGVISVPHLSTTLKLQIYSNKKTIKLFFSNYWDESFKVVTAVLLMIQVVWNVML
jgi:hypothetical protein